MARRILTEFARTEAESKKVNARIDRGKSRRFLPAFLVVWIEKAIAKNKSVIAGICFFMVESQHLIVI